MRSTSIFRFYPPILLLPELKSIWKKHRPDASRLFQRMAAYEDWVSTGALSGTKIPETMQQVLMSATSWNAGNSGKKAGDLYPQLTEVLACFSAEQCVYAIAWLNEHTEHAIPLWKWIAAHAKEHPEANAVLWRVRACARHQVLHDLAAMLDNERNHQSGSP